MALRVGIDLVEVDGVRRSVIRFADRYLARVYSPQEIADCSSPRGVDAERLAARFAAKEAAIKALRPGDAAIPWRAIEVGRGAGGAPDLLLHGAAAELAGDAGLTEWAVSLTHEAEYASAVVVAEARA